MIPNAQPWNKQSRMSVEANIKAARESVEHLLAGDFRSLMAGYTDDCVWHIAPGAAQEVVSYFGTWRGKREIMECFARALASPIQETRFELDRYYGIGDRVFAFGQADYVDVTTGNGFTTRQYYELVYRDGKLCELSRALDTAAFYKAYKAVDKSALHSFLNFYEEAPHLDLNADESTIDLSNWHEPANRHWSYRHIGDIFPFVRAISRGDGAVAEFGTSRSDLSKAGTFARGLEMELEEYLHETHVDGFLVLKDNSLVYENHRRMHPDDLHACQSSTKSTVCAVVGHLVGRGLIDLSRTVDHYIPEIGEAYSGVSIQDVLDMRAPVDFTEDFTDPHCDLADYDRHSGLSPDAGGAWDKGLFYYLKRLRRDDSGNMQDGGIRYLCTNSDLLGCIVERVTGQAFTTVFESAIYAHLGAEGDALFVTDSKGAAVANGGLSLRLRDFARFGSVFANRGIAPDGARVIPEFWIDGCLETGAGPAYFIDNVEYHNHMTTNGEFLCHMGLGGQALYANPTTGVVIVQFATLTMPSGSDLDSGSAFYLLAGSIDAQLR